MALFNEDSVSVLFSQTISPYLLFFIAHFTMVELEVNAIPHRFYFSLWSECSLEQLHLRTKARRLKRIVQLSTENQERCLKGLVGFSPSVLVKDCNLIYKSERANEGVIFLFEWVGVSPYLL